MPTILERTMNQLKRLLALLIVITVFATSFPGVCVQAATAKKYVKSLKVSKSKINVTKDNAVKVSVKVTDDG